MKIDGLGSSIIQPYTICGQWASINLWHLQIGVMLLKAVCMYTRKYVNNFVTQNAEDCECEDNFSDKDF